MNDDLFEREELFELLLQQEGIDLTPAPVITRRDNRVEAPLSFAQSRLWFLDRLDGASPNYNMPGVLRLDGDLDVEALRISLQEIRNRHEALRTRFVTRSGEAVQVIDPPSSFALPLADLSGLNADDREKHFRRLVSQHAAQPFDLATGPLLRAQLVRLAACQHVLLFAMHHIISDGWSVAVLIHELTVLYRAFHTGLTPQLPELSIQYADYAEWQRAHLTPESLAPTLSYWRERLAGAPQVLNLPTDRPRPPVQTYRGRTHQFRIGSDLTDRLRSISRKYDCTLFIVLQAGFAALLSRYNGSEDLIFGTPVANRNVAGLEPLIGFFVNTLVLRTNLSGDPTFGELIARVRSATLRDLDHQDLPFEILVDELQPQRNLSYTPLIQALLILQNTPHYELELPDLTVSVEEPESHIAKFDITVSLTETTAGLAGEIEYNTDLFDASTIARIAGHLENMLAALSRNPDLRVSEVDFLSAEEVDLLLRTWNATDSDFPGDKCIQELFEQQAADTPQVIAVVFRDRQLTYAELNARANQLARYLRKLGVGPEVAVPIICERSIELIVGILGIIKAGGAYVPLDPKYPADRLEYMFGEVRSPVVLTHRACAGRLPQSAAVRLLLDDDWHTIALESGENLNHQTKPDSLAYIIFTSGSTGRPKGVRVVHHGVVRLVKNINYASLSADEVILQLTPISFDVSTFEIWGSLLNGGRLVVPPPEIPSFEEIGRYIKDYGITTMWLTSGLFHLMVDENLDGLRPLRQLIAGGDVLSVPHCRRVLREIPGLRLINGYGPTECTTFTTCCTLTEETIGHSVSIGRPVSNTQVYILDKHRKLVPPGCPGELCAGGYGLARDYLNDPELTAEKFIAHPFDSTPGARLYRIGDLCRYLPDGNIEYLGRFDRQVKIRGFRIELGEIETVLSSLDAVRDCVVTTWPDPGGNKQLVAYLIAAHPDRVPDEADLRAALTKQLPEFMVPSAFVLLDSLPLNPNGKIDRDELPDPEDFFTESEYVAPGTDTEKALVQIWARLLDLSRVGVHDNFFAAGGNSLLAIQLVSRIRDRFDVELRVRQVFETPTIARLAAHLDGLQLDENRAERLPPITRQARDQDLPLSFAQQRLWFLYQLDPGSAAYNLPITVRLSGRLRVDLLGRCFDEIVRRHESLRTNFLERDGRAVQVIHDQRSVELRSQDLTALPADQRDTEWQRLVQTEGLRPFNLESDSLLRLLLLRLAEDDHVLLVTMHHIVSDGWSFGVWIDEVSALYRSFAEGLPSPLAELPVQYADFAAWQRSWLKGDFLHEQLAYWRAQLSGAPTLLELPTDRPRPTVQSYPGRIYLFEIEAALGESLSELSRQSGASLFMTLLAAYAGILSRYSGQHDVVVGSPVANRKHSDTESLIGFFINTLALRVDLSADPTFRELLARVRQMTLNAFAHDDLPLEQLVEELEPQRNLSHSPIFQTLFVLQNAPMKNLELPELRLTTIEQQSRVAKFDLTLTLEETDGGLQGEFEYNTDLFDHDTISRLAMHLVRFLADAVACPDERISRLQILSGVERQRLLSEWNHGEVVDGDPICIPRWFEQQTAHTPEAVAVVAGEQSWTYHQLNTRANQLARFLRARGVGADTPVGLCLERCGEMVIAQLGVLKAGAAYVPLDPNYPDERLAFMIRDAGMPLLLTETKWLAGHPQDSLETICLDTDWSRISGESDANLTSSPAPDDLAYIMYTSGSTGQPKGVMIAHRALANHMRWMQRTFSITSADRVLQKTPFSFDASVWEFYLPLLTGGVLVLARPDGHSDSEYLVDAIRVHGVTIFQGVPSLLRMLVETPGFREADSLRYIFSGGETLTADLRDKLLDASHATVCNLYGPTEACIDATFYVCSRDEPRQPGVIAVPIGRPIQNATAYVLDEHQQPVPAGVPGELYLGGVPLGRGYWNQPALTAQRFVDNPFGAGRLYRTGDRVSFRADGNLQFLGRTDQQIKLRGYRIELGEIEAAVRKHTAVDDAAVVVNTGRADDQRLVAFVQAVEGQTLSISEMRLNLKAQLPEYMIPTAWAVLERLPRLPNGKINRSALPLQEAVGETTEKRAAPVSGTEQLLMAIWTEILDCGHIGRHDNFFELGGHSLLATQLASRVRDAFSAELPLRHIFEAPTLAELAEVVDTEVRAQKHMQPLPKIQPASRGAELPLSFSQERLWFLHQFEVDNPFYNMPMALELTGELDIAAVRRALEEVVRRHESLRTSFGSTEGKPTQHIAADWKLALPIVDLTDFAPHQLPEEVGRRAEEEALRTFDLSRDLLLRATLLRLAEDRHVLLLTLHHIAADGWSMGVLVDEMTQLYTAFAGGRSSPLPELKIQYADFAVWQRENLRSQVLDVQLRYWKRQLAGAPTVLSLPADRRRPAVQTFRGGQARVRIDPELSSQLRSLSQSCGCTLFMTLLSGFTALLFRYTGEDDILIGTPIANRNRREIEPLIGFFVNTLVIRTDLSGDPGFRQLLTRMRRTALDAYAHQDLPFEQLVEQLKPDRDTSRNPLVQISFALQNAPMPPLELEGLTVKSLDFEAQTVRFDMEFHLWDSSEGIEGYLLYYRDIFEQDSIVRFLNHFENLLRAAVAQPDVPLSVLPLVTEQQQQTLLQSWGRGPEWPVPNQCVHQLIEDQARQTPDALAVVVPTSARGSQNQARFSQTLTYGELNARANQLAHYLRQQGAGPDVLVGICVDRSLEMVVGLLGILKAGAAYVPLNPAYPPARLAFMLEDAQTPILVTKRQYGAAIPGLPAHVIELDSDHEMIEEYPTHNPDSGVRPDHLAYVIYTSGSTGRPKGVLIEHRGLVNYLSWARAAYNVPAGVGAPVNSSISFDATVTSLFTPLVSGRRVELLPEANEIEQLCALLLSDQDFSLVKITPAHLELLSRLLPAEPVAGQSRAFVIGGEALTASHLAFWRKYAPAIRLINEYGPTETVVGCCVYEVPRDEPLAENISIGWPIANTQLYVLDSQFQPLPIGVPGELYIGGAGVGRGYLNRDDLTAQRFVRDPFSKKPRARLFKTGDRVRYHADGKLEFLGRLDSQVKIRGYRIEPGEIEAAIQRHSAVQSAHVVVREDQPGEKRLVAYIKAHPELESNVAEWRASDEQLSIEHTLQWQRVFEESYGQAMSPPDPAFDITGWNSGYTGEPIPAEQMREWVETTVARILALKPSQVYEIGCGTGLLLTRIAPHCARYLGTDFSRAAIEHLARLCESVPGLERAVFQQRAADDFSQISPDSFDLVILNSVVQYFSNLDYFLRVFDGAINAVRPGGSLFFGDIRSLPLLKAYHASVQLFQAPDNLSAAQLRQRVNVRIAQENELLIDPTLFLALQRRYPKIGDIRLLVKRGKFHNEMSAFRFDAVVRLGEETNLDHVPWIDWQQSQLSLAGVRRILQAERLDVLGLSAVANARLQNEMRVLEWLDSAEDHEPVEQLRQRLSATSNALDPEALFTLGEELGYHVEASWAMDSPEGQLDVIFSRGLQPRPIGPTGQRAFKPLHSYANNPLRRKASLKLIPEIRSSLQHELPEYMLPAAFVLVDEFPLTANGKLDYRALPAPAATSRNIDKEFVAPQTEKEKMLAEIWSEVLGLERVGVRDNFFELGGDSILSIQIVWRATRAGISLSPRQLFQYQTIEELAAVVGESRWTDEPDFATGEVPLTPIQHWFFAADQPEPHYFNQAILLETAPGLDSNLLQQAFEHLPRHHHSLRLRFSRHAGLWRQDYADDEQSAAWTVIDWSRESLEARQKMLQQTAERLQSSLDLTNGPLIQAAYFHGAANESGRLLWIIHHLLVDGVSWRILLEDLETACHQLEQGQPIVIPPVPTSWRRWSQRLQAYARSPEIRAEFDFWQSVSSSNVRDLPADGAASSQENINGNWSSQSFQLAAELTEALLHDVPPVYHTRINDILLTALVETFAVWTSERTLLLDLEGHGREDLFPDLQVERTIGWFTTIFPVCLNLQDCASPGEAIKSIKEQLRRISRHGIGYGLLRYLAEDESIRVSLSNGRQPEVAFNYLGQLDGALGKSRYFHAASEPSGPSIGSRYRRRHQLEINASVTSGSLLVEWSFNLRRFKQETIRRLGQIYLDQLQALIEHCRSSESGGFTPSDFAAANVGQKNLDRLLSKLKSNRESQLPRS